VYTASDATGGNWTFNSSNCESGCECPDLTGAADESSCEGVYQSVGDSQMCTLLCESTEATGACCKVGSGHVCWDDQTEDECGDGGYTWLGAGSTCEDDCFPLAN